MTETIDAKDYAKVMRKKSHTAAKPVKTADGYFASQKEFKRWQELKLLEKAGAIKSLKRQVPIRIEVNGYLIKTYKADFEYWDTRTYLADSSTIEDTKGRRFREWILTKKLLQALGYRVIES